MKTLESSLERRLDETFARVARVPATEMELRSDYARYLCVLVSGYAEAAVSAIATRHCSQRSSPSVARFAERSLRRVQNLKAEKLLQLVGAFDPAWRAQLAEYVEGARREALDSVVDLKNHVAHGGSVGVTYAQAKEYYNCVREVVQYVARLMS